MVNRSGKKGRRRTAGGGPKEMEQKKIHTPELEKSLGRIGARRDFKKEV